MSTKRILSLIVLVIVVGVVLFIVVLYATIKTKSTSLRAYAPFNEWVGKTVILHSQTVLFDDKMATYDNSAYPYLLLDSLHPRWKYAAQQENIGYIEEIVKLPEGTQLKVEKATQYSNGVSGSSYPTLFGTIVYNGVAYKIAYQWGEIDVSKSFDKIDKCWAFHQAPWQRQQDTSFYALPKANFW